jgi:hypothetical protein
MIDRRHQGLGRSWIIVIPTGYQIDCSNCIACTRYPLLRHVIKRCRPNGFVYKNILLIDQAFWPPLMIRKYSAEVWNSLNEKDVF